MELIRVDPADGDAVRRLVAVTNAARSVDSPWLHELTELECVGELRWGWDCDPDEWFVAVVDGVDVAAVSYETSSYDNQHLVWFGIEVDPAHRRRGHGSAAHDLLLERARAEGRTTIGMAGWDAPGPVAFAERHGLVRGSVEMHRRQYLDGDWSLPAIEHDPAYELVRWPTTTPPADLHALADLTAAINDAPTDDLDVEDEVFSPERIAAYERAWAERGQRLHRLVARHRETGELAGQTVVAVDAERPAYAEQHDTSVIRAHRGHRLGLSLKVEMLRWLAEAEPQVRELDTWNAESNDHMIGVNEQLGYRVLGRALDFQRSI